MTKIVVIGGGGHAKVLISVLKKTNYEIIGYTDPILDKTILDTPHRGDDSCLERLISANPKCHAVIGVGKIDISQKRLDLQKKFTRIGFSFPVIISPAAIANEAIHCGPGTVVLDNAVINSGSIIGKTCIVNTSSTIEHDCHIGDNVHIAPSATLSGGVTIGENCMIGAGATIIHGVEICADCLIGAGSTVIKNIIEPGIYVGCPAKRLS